MKVIEIRRYPVKSMLGEVVPATDVGTRGIAGDRLWAVRDPAGKFGSGKNTRRFRRMPGLFSLRAYAADPAPVVELPDGRRFTATDPDGHRAVSEILGRPVTLAPETSVPHHDEGPVSLITTASLRRLSELAGGDPGGGDPGGSDPGGSDPGRDRIDALRFRANLLVDIPGTGFAEDDWPGRRLRIGGQVVLRLVRPLTRCVMIDMAQDGVGDRNDLLKTLAAHHELTFGVYATVERPGRIAIDDPCTWT